MNYRLEDKVAVVMAASKGLGRAAAAALCAEGCRVAICSRDEKKSQQAAASIMNETGGEVYAGVADVGTAGQIETFIQAVIARWGHVDILVTNAGGPPVKTFEETSDEEWEKYFQITFMSTVRSIRQVMPEMKKAGWGRIINITSISVKEPLPGLIYSNSLRAAVVGLAKTLSQELGPSGITVNNVAPGYHRTDGLERIVRKRMEAGEKRDDIFNTWQQQVPLRKIGEPEDLAALITFLASDASRYISGTTIQVDGGRTGAIL